MTADFVSFPTPYAALEVPQDVGTLTQIINELIRYINTIAYGDNIGTTALLKANNLSDVDSAATSRTNLGLGSAATRSSTAFDAGGAAAAVQALSLQKAQNLADLVSASAARGNLGLGSAAVLSSTDFDPAGAAAARAGKGVNTDITALTALSVKVISSGNYNVVAGDQYLLVLATTGDKTVTYNTGVSAGQVRVVKGDATYNPVNISDGSTTPIFSLVSPAIAGYCQGVTVLKSTLGIKCF